MSDDISDNSHAPSDHRIFLVVADDSPEMAVAVRFACRRARPTRREGTTGLTQMNTDSP